MLVDIANGAARLGNRVSACVTRSRGALAADLRGDVPLAALDRNQRFDLPAMRRFASLVAAQGVDLFHAHGRSTFSFLAAMRTLGLTRLPIVFHDHSGVELDASVPVWFRIWARHFVGQYVAVSSRQLDWARRAGVPKDKSTVIENALDLDRLKEAKRLDLRSELSIPVDKTVGVVVGGIRPEKGIDVLLEAIAKSALKGSAVILVLGGLRDAEYSQSCESRRSALRLSDSVLFVGERRDAPSVIKSADFAVIPSRSESGPLVLIEYLANGVPFVGTRVGAIAERMAQRNLPEFVAPGDSDALAAALDRLLALDEPARRQRGRVGQEIARAQFDIQRVLPRWYAVYDSALATS